MTATIGSSASVSCSVDSMKISAQAATSADTCLSQVARDKLKKLEEFSGEMLTAERTRDPALDVILIEFNPMIFQKRKALSDEEMIALLGYCLALKALSLSGFFRITNTILPPIADLKMLVTLNLSGTKVNDLQPLVDNPLPNLKIANFFNTSIPNEAFVKFLEVHQICDLTTPQNPPAKFFASFRSDFLEKVKVFIGSTANEILRYDEIMDFFKHAPRLVDLFLWIDAQTKFNSDDVSDPPLSRKISIKSRNMAFGCQLSGKNESFPLSS